MMIPRASWFTRLPSPNGSASPQAADSHRALEVGAGELGCDAGIGFLLSWSPAACSGSV